MPSDAVIFDLGGVVLSWDPRAAYELRGVSPVPVDSIQSVRMGELHALRHPFGSGSSPSGR